MLKRDEGMCSLILTLEKRIVSIFISVSCPAASITVVVDCPDSGNQRSGAISWKLKSLIIRNCHSPVLGLENTKRSGRISQPRPQEQAASHDISCQRREITGNNHLVRQLLCAATPRRPFAVGLQARNFHSDAGPANSTVRTHSCGK